MYIYSKYYLFFEPRNPVVNNAVASTSQAVSSITLWWIGIRTERITNQPRKFFYLSGGPDTSLSFEWWESGEPNNSGAEDCVQINYPGHVIGRWNDNECERNMGSICEMGNEII